MEIHPLMIYVHFTPTCLSSRGVVLEKISAPTPDPAWPMPWARDNLLSNQCARSGCDGTRIYRQSMLVVLYLPLTRPMPIPNRIP